MTTSTRQRKGWTIALGAAALLLFVVFVASNAFDPKFLNPESTRAIFVYTGLSALAFVLFVGVLVMLVRNVLKLYADQKNRVMGSRLRVRMLWGAVLVSLLPIGFMFLFSYLLMNRSVDRWFSQPVTQMRDDSNRMALELAQYTSANARVEAEAISSGLPSGVAKDKPAKGVRPEASERKAIEQVLRQHEITLQGGFAIVYEDGKPVVDFHMPQRDGKTAEVKPWLPETPAADEEDDSAKNKPEIIPPMSDTTDAAILAAAQRNDQPVFSLGKLDFALGTAATKQGSTVVVGLPMPYGMSSTMAELRKAADDYWVLFRGRRQLRNTYMLLLAMLTTLALFCSSWLALHLSKQVTRPVEALADAMESIAAGNYAQRVAESATEELGELVRSFNHMAADLESSRAQVEASTVQLSAANSALEARRGELETMLETIPNGVATLDPERRIVLANRALGELLDPGGERPFIGQRMDDVFTAEILEVFDRMIGRSHRMGSASSEMEMTQPTGATLNLLATVALLEGSSDGNGGRRHLGYVLVLENATELLRAQKQSAWKEVARRVAHEIKNPLTPISLSAEQIGRHIDRLNAQIEERGFESNSVSVIRRCSEVITSSVESMRSLVDQFAALAEFPTAKPRPADLNTIVENSLAQFAGRLQKIKLKKRLGRGLPLVMADPEAMKRALGNLIDNAAEAMQQSLLRELTVSTSLLVSGMVELTVSDTGPGLTEELRERLFLPYFSTKQRGTGLGLAIAAKIVQEHQGTIRAEKNEPAGALFIVELRTATVSELGEEEMQSVQAGGSVL